MALKTYNRGGDVALTLHVLDGDLDANWIESMNSVMDDNRYGVVFGGGGLRRVSGDASLKKKKQNPTKKRKTGS